MNFGLGALQHSDRVPGLNLWSWKNNRDLSNPNHSVRDWGKNGTPPACSPTLCAASTPEKEHAVVAVLLAKAGEISLLPRLSSPETRWELLDSHTLGAVQRRQPFWQRQEG